MTARSIVPIGSPILRTPTRRVDAADVSSPKVQKLDDLIDAMRASGGAGIAANQVGEDLRITVIEVSGNLRYPYKTDIPLTICINPEWAPLDDDKVSINEGCLSVPLRGRPGGSSPSVSVIWTARQSPPSAEARAHRGNVPARDRPPGRQAHRRPHRPGGADLGVVRHPPS